LGNGPGTRLPPAPRIEPMPAGSLPPAPPGSASAISDRDFTRISDFIYRSAGIALTPSKKTLVAGRLFRRLEVVGAGSYGEYLDIVEAGPADGEMQTAIDLLTTNETYFWRESRHFELAERLAREAAAARRPFSIWSAACSTGEEVYTLAMVLDSVRAGGMPLDWRIVGSDISTRVLRTAQRGLYPLDRSSQLPQALLRKYCRKGTGPQAGYLLVDRALRGKVEFVQINLVDSLPDTALFDMIFLRNVMIYFDAPTKSAVVTRLLTRLKPGGTFCVGLAETLNGIVGGLKSSGPGAYCKAAP
jgi:chemotaxis protein methyltransferase CheR